MGILHDIRAAWSAPSVSDDGQWTTQGGSSGAYSAAYGGIITEQVALSNPVVFDCAHILMDAVGQSPAILYDRSGARGEERQRSTSALAYRLAEEPNDDQSAIEFKREMQQAAAFYRFAYAEITWRGTEPLDIRPRHPNRVRVETVGGRKRYGYLEDDGITWRGIVPADMLRVPGRPVLEYAGETLGHAIALERYSRNLFGRGIRPSVAIEAEKGVTYTDPQKHEIKRSLQQNHSGVNSGGAMWVPEGLHINAFGMTNKDAEYTAVRNALIGDITRYWRIPAYMVGLLESGTVSYASVSTQGIDFVVYCLMPWLVGWEQAMQRALVIDKRGQFVEFLTAQLLQGTTKERYDVYQVAIQNDIMNADEVRRLENLNPRAGGDGFLTPLNMTTGQARHVEAGSPADRLLQALTSDAAANVLRRETAALARLAEKAGPDAKAWEAGVREFYDGHAAYVAEKLKLPQPTAVAWTTQQQYAVLADGPGVVSEWTASRDREQELVALAMERADPSIAASVIGGLRSEVRDLRARQPVNVTTTVEPSAPASISVPVHIDSLAVTDEAMDRVGAHLADTVEASARSVIATVGETVAALSGDVADATAAVRDDHARAVESITDTVRDATARRPVRRDIFRDARGDITSYVEDDGAARRRVTVQRDESRRILGTHEEPVA